MHLAAPHWHLALVVALNLGGPQPSQRSPFCARTSLADKMADMDGFTDRTRPATATCRLCLATVVCLLSWISSAEPPGVIERIDVEPVWSGHPVGFALLTHDDRQFVAYYDADRRMAVAARRLNESRWHTVKLPEQVKWDSHNFLTMAIDKKERIHLSGNMHVKPLVYFRTSTPLDIDTFQHVPMVGEREDRVTYPQFLRGPRNRLVFTYRDGQSGKGDQIYNVYDDRRQTWKRLLDTPLTSGEGKMNAYFSGPAKGPDGRFHLCWVWRDHFGCESNHDLCYARSKDLVHWESSSGKPLALPITLRTAEIVDPVPAGGGMINSNIRLGFDSKKRVILSYHKFDAAGNTQLHNARLEKGAWKIYQTSDWDYRWEFSGGGSIISEIHISGVTPNNDGSLRQSFSHKKYGNVTWILDEATLTPVATAPEERKHPNDVAAIENPYPGMKIRSARDLGHCPERGCSYVLQWETLDANRDKPREGAPPPPSMLRVLKRSE